MSFAEYPLEEDEIEEPVPQQRPLPEPEEDEGQEKESQPRGGGGRGPGLGDLQKAKGAADKLSGLGSKLGGGAAKQGASAAAGGASAATGAGGAAAGAGAGAAGGVGGGAAAGATAGSVVPGAGTAAGAAAGAVIGLLRKKLFRLLKWLIGLGAVVGCLGCLFALLFPLLIIVIIILAIMGAFGGGDSGSVNAQSKVIKIVKKVDKTSIPRGSGTTELTYTITVVNLSSDDATNVSVTDTFSSSPETGFASEITGYEATYTIPKLEGFKSDTKTFKVTVSHLDYDPGWILFNTAKVTATMVAVPPTQETSNSTATVVIGNPPTGPPAYSPLRHPDSTGGYTYLQPVTNSQGVQTLHEGLDIHDNSDRAVLSPFAQPAQVTLNSFDNGYGNYVILRSGEWEVYLTHLDERSSVKVGDSVDSNKQIGIMGCSGYCFGAHVHYEVHRNGSTVNPELYNALTPHP